VALRSRWPGPRFPLRSGRCTARTVVDPLVNKWFAHGKSGVESGPGRRLVYLRINEIEVPLGCSGPRWRSAPSRAEVAYGQLWPFIRSRCASVTSGFYSPSPARTGHPGDGAGHPGRANLAPALGPARHIKVLLDAFRRPGRQRRDRASRRRRTPHQLGGVFLALSSRRPGAWPLIGVQNHVLPPAAHGSRRWRTGWSL
jgi:hypothetical protein